MDFRCHRGKEATIDYVKVREIAGETLVSQSQKTCPPSEAQVNVSRGDWLTALVPQMLDGKKIPIGLNGECLRSGIAASMKRDGPGKRVVLQGLNSALSGQSIPHR